MKTIRLFVYFCVGLLLGATAVLSHADYAATPNCQYTNGSGWYPTPSEACSAYGQPYCGKFYLDGFFPNGENKCSINDPGQCGVGSIQISSSCSGYKCPNGGTLSGQTCVHTCPEGQTEQADGSCMAQCPMYPGAVDEPSAQPANCQCPAGSVWFYNGCRKKCSGSGETAGAAVWGDPTIFYPGGAAEGCYNGCGVQGVPGVYYKANGGEYYNHSTYTGWACNGNGEGTKPTPDNQPQPNNPEKPAGEPHEPKCNGENVVTRSDGTVVCMPAGTPNTHKPKTEEVTKSEQYSDGSSKETTTHTTTDPGTGAKYYITTTTITPATGGGAGQAGQPGTSTSTTKGGTTGEGSGAGKDGGECDPTKDMCGSPSTDGLYEKKNKTFGEVIGKFNSDMKATPIGAAFTSFLNVNIPGGSCPSWTADVAFLNIQLDIGQYFCTPTAIQMMEAAGFILLAGVAFIGFRWALGV